MKTNTIFVIGASGFIGSLFISLILNEKPNCRVVCVDCNTYASNDRISGEFEGKNNFIFYRNDIRNQSLMNVIFSKEKPSIVINFAAETHVDRSIKDPSIFFDTNIIGTSVLLECCRKYGVERFHQVSTDEVYGDLPLDRPDLLFKENDILNPSSPYSSSKASADLLALSYYKTYGVPVTISRCSNNFGPYQFPEKLIPLMISKAEKNEPLPIYGDGSNIRDWIYVEDHCRGILAILEKGKPGEIYNLGGHNEYSNLDIVKRILKQMGKDESLISFVKDRPGHDRRYALDTTKANNELGWYPTTSFEEGLSKTIQWYQSEYGKKWTEQCVESEQEWLKANYEDRK